VLITNKFVSSCFVGSLMAWPQQDNQFVRYSLHSHGRSSDMQHKGPRPVSTSWRRKMRRHRLVCHRQCLLDFSLFQGEHSNCNSNANQYCSHGNASTLYLSNMVHHGVSPSISDEGVRRSQDSPGAKIDESTAEAPSVVESNRDAVHILERCAAESSEAPGGRKREKTQLQYDNPSFVAAPCRGRLWWQARHQIASKWLLESVDAVNLGGGERLGDPCEGNPKPKNLQDKEFHSRDMVSHIVSEEGIAASTDSRVASSKVAGVGVVSGEVGGTILEEDFVSRFPWGPKYSRLESIDEEQAEIAYMSSPSFVALAIRCQEVCFKEGLVTYKEYGAVSQYIGGESARERGEFLLQLADDRRKGGNAEPVDYVDSYGRTRLDMSKGRVCSNVRANTPST